MLRIHRAHLNKQFLSIDDNGKTIFCYYEKGSKVSQEPSIIFIRGFSANKNAWLNIIKDIPDSIHCIAIDLPGHRESVGFTKEQLLAINIIDNLKLFFDKLNLIEPMCLVGGSMGGSIVSMFATKYKSYVSMICLLAPPPPGEEYETDIIRELRSGTYNKILPETTEQLRDAIDSLSMKKVHFRHLLAKVHLKSRLPKLNQHKKILKSAFENDYPNLRQYYKQLANLTCPVLIIWGRQDQLCAVETIDYFCNLIPNATPVILNNCGHLITRDKPKETAISLISFWKKHHDYETNL